MKKAVCLLSVLMAYSASAATDEGHQQGGDNVSSDSDSAWKYRFRLNKFERQFSTANDSDFGEWAGYIRVEKELDTFWLTTKGSTQQSETDSAEIRLLYSRTIKPYIDLHLGWRRDLKPEPERDWLGFGVLGILPYKIGTDVSFFIGESGRFATRLEIAYRHRMTSRLSLTPDLEANFYSEDDPDRDIGSGLSDLDFGLRLRYKIIRGVLPYVGITWKGNFGKTADIIESKGEEASDLRLLLGLTLRF